MSIGNPKIGVEVNAGLVTQEIVRREWMDRFIIPRYTPAGWWECDVFEVTKSGYWTEYEIKTTVADFRKDRDKKKAGRTRWNSEAMRPEQLPDLNKHELLAAGDERGPCRFVFVVPKGLIAVEDVPPWAGLMEFYPYPSTRYGSAGRIGLRTVRQPPKLHKGKVASAVLRHAESVCYYRMHRLMETDRFECRELVGGDGI